MSSSKISVDKTICFPKLHVKAAKGAPLVKALFCFIFWNRGRFILLHFPHKNKNSKDNIYIVTSPWQKNNIHASRNMPTRCMWYQLTRVGKRETIPDKDKKYSCITRTEDNLFHQGEC
jgi:hypothetical protein